MEEKVYECIEEHGEELSNKELEELKTSSIEEEEGKEIKARASKWYFKRLGEVFRLGQDLKKGIVHYDPLIEPSIKVTTSTAASYDNNVFPKK
ncbi:hypothetical protein QE152_g22366 [Popillia japonica]|uniref:Uncharacterized protein n=1 Tax=Popillia japonica TaxID=7064 RepID=A0AAW1KL51_POPJA